jgi:hypothetical protein
MKSMLAAMKKRGSGIPKDKVRIFEEIIRKYEAFNAPSLGPQCDEEFNDAMETHLSQEQRYWLYEQNGGCKGTGHDAKRKDFAREHGHKPLAERLAMRYGQKAVLNQDNTITVTFACKHGYYKQAREGEHPVPPPKIQAYFERCAGGRLYGLQKEMGIKLKIKSVDASPLYENSANPVVFTFDIVG